MSSDSGELAPHDEYEQRHLLVLIENMLREGRTQPEIEARLSSLTGRGLRPRWFRLPRLPLALPSWKRRSIQSWRLEDENA